MGEIAEMVLDGTMCAGCGVYLNDGYDGDGFPGYCAGCSPDFEQPLLVPNVYKRGKEKKAKCEMCGKKVLDSIALRQHKRDKHGVAQ